VRKGQQLAVEVALRSARRLARTTCATSRVRIPLTARASPTSCRGTAEELGIDEQEGVVILQVRPDSKAARIGFQPGDIIQQVGRKKIEAVTELEAVLKERQQVVAGRAQARQPIRAAAAGGLSRSAGVRPRRRCRRPRWVSVHKGLTPWCRQRYDCPMTNLFQAAGLEKEAPRPLADRLRPKKLAEVVGQTISSGPWAR
jgi:hypothetical protein